MLKVEVYKEEYRSNNSKKPLRKGFHDLMAGVNTLQYLSHHQIAV